MDNPPVWTWRQTLALIGVLTTPLAWFLADWMS
jgi:dolichyl-phosphate-mannose--protein O-mannosyl transferase